MRVTEERSHQIAGIVWAGVWMFPLLSPLAAMFRGQVHPLWPAAVGFVGFVILYLLVVLNAFSDEPRPQRSAFGLLAVMAGLGTALAAGYAGQPDSWLGLMLYVTVAGTATLRKPRHVACWLIVWSAVTVAIGLAYRIDGGTIGAEVFSTFMAGILVYTVRQMVGLIRQLRQTQQALAETAVTQERLRFSRDLHDLLGHTLSLMVVKAELARRLGPSDPRAAAREAGDIEAIGRKALAEVREAVTGYRERVLAEELDGARAALTDAGIDVTVREIGSPLPATVNDVFGWTLREAVTNVIRHSGATRCEIDVRREGDTATLEIVDNGVTPPAAPGNGLRGLGERLDALGGTFTAAPAPGGGFRVLARVPARVMPKVPAAV
jgi:two-component system, NarL family, sensor histidine kinase DesK